MKTLIDVIDPRNQPLLIHCNKGKHRTGSIVGCLRKLRGWSYSSIFSEYILFSWPKTRVEDQICIESFDVHEFWQYYQSFKISYSLAIPIPLPSENKNDSSQNHKDISFWLTR